MSTSSYICKKEEDGTIKMIYCHFDGDYNSVLLPKYYNTPEKVDALIELGDLSSLGKKISPTNATHDIDHPEPGVCVAYGRDAQCDDTAAKIFKSKEAFIEAVNDNFLMDYIYLWEDNQWKYAKGVNYIYGFPNRRLTAKSFKSLI
jgi:hypothetical protein